MSLFGDVISDLVFTSGESVCKTGTRGHGSGGTDIDTRGKLEV